MINSIPADPRRGRSALAAFAAGPRTAPRPAPESQDTTAQTLMAMRNAARWVRSAPQDLRDSAFERIAPMLASLAPIELIERLRRAPKDDRSLDGLIAELDRHLRGMNAGAGDARADTGA